MRQENTAESIKQKTGDKLDNVRAAVPEPETVLRVLAVGDQPFADRIRELFDQIGIAASIDTTSGYLTALGHIGTSPPPSILIGRVEDLNDPFKPITDSLRQLLPKSRLLLVSQPEHEPDTLRALAAGFDDYFIEPVDIEEFRRVIRDEKDDLDETEDPLRSDSLEGPGFYGDSLDIRGDLDSQETFSKHERQPVDDEDAATDTGLAEVDLVEHLLHERDGLRDLALQLIANRSGFKDVSWAPSQEIVPEDHEWVPILFKEQRMGVLSAAPPASGNDLERWAAWLARWLSLDKMVARLWKMALRDDLTGAWNRRYFQRFLNSIIDRAAQERFHVTLMVFDIDDFKQYNDRYGHPAGDEILYETTKLMQSVVREHDVVARIGGDEFAVIFWDATTPRRPNSAHPHDPSSAAERFRKEIVAHKFPKLGKEAPGQLTISGGLAGFPWDGRTPEELLERADEMALQSKRQGKNAITIGPGAERNSAESRSST